MPLKHKIEKGETIELIAKKYGVNPSVLYQLNPGLSDGFNENDLIIISKKANDQTNTDPVIIYHVVLPNETKYGLSKKYNISSIFLLNIELLLSDLVISIFLVFMLLNLRFTIKYFNNFIPAINDVITNIAHICNIVKSFTFNSFNISLFLSKFTNNLGLNITIPLIIIRINNTIYTNNSIVLIFLIRLYLEYGILL